MKTGAVILLLVLFGCGGTEPSGEVPLDMKGLDRYLAVAKAIRAAGAEFDTARATDPSMVRAQVTALAYRDEYAGALADAGLTFDEWISLHRRVMAGLGAVMTEDLTATRLKELEAQRANLTPEQYEAIRAGTAGSGEAFAAVPAEVRDLVRRRRADIEAAWK